MLNGIIYQHNYLEIKKCKWGFFSYNIYDEFIGKSLKMYGEWSEPELDLLTKFISPEDVIIDGGANIGTHAIFFAKMAPKGKIIAFEPQKLNFQLLHTNMTLNTLNNIDAYQFALSDRKDNIIVPWIPPDSSFNFGAFRLEECKSGEKIPTVTIDEYDFKKINLIKLDIEGMEKKALKGAHKTIIKFRPILFVENNTIRNSSELIEELFALNYKCFWHFSSYFNKHNFFRNQDDLFSSYYPESNMLCFHKSLNISQPELIEVKDVNDNWFKALERLFKDHKGMGLNFTEKQYSLMKK